MEEAVNAAETVNAAKAVNAYQCQYTSVYWDKDYFGGSDSLVHDILRLLNNMGFSGPASIFIYGEDISDDHGQQVHIINSVEVRPSIVSKCVTPENKEEKMMSDLLGWVALNARPASIFIAFAKNASSVKLCNLVYRHGFYTQLFKRQTVCRYIVCGNGSGAAGLEVEEKSGKGKKKKTPEGAFNNCLSSRDNVYLSSQTSVWWDMATCKAPPGCDLNDVPNNIRSSLHYIGFSGSVSIFTYGDTDTGLSLADQVKLFSHDVNVKHVSVHDSNAVMLRDMADWVLSNPGAANILLVSSRTDLVESLKYSEYNLLFAVPRSHYSSMVPDEDTTWIYSDLLAGGCPSRMEGKDMGDLKHQYKAMYKKYKRSRISVWWDFENCGIPKEIERPNVMSIVSNIESAVRKLGYTKPISFNICGKLYEHLSKSDLEILTEARVHLIFTDNPDEKYEHKKYDHKEYERKRPKPAKTLLMEGSKKYKKKAEKKRVREEVKEELLFYFFDEEKELAKDDEEKGKQKAKKAEKKRVREEAKEKEKEELLFYFFDEEKELDDEEKTRKKGKQKALDEKSEKKAAGEGKKKDTDKLLISNMMSWVCKAGSLSSPPSTLLLISGDGDFHYTLQKLRVHHKANILLAVGRRANDRLKSGAITLWEWEKLARGEPPKYHGLSWSLGDFKAEDSDSLEEDSDSLEEDGDSLEEDGDSEFFWGSSPSQKMHGMKGQGSSVEEGNVATGGGSVSTASILIEENDGTVSQVRESSDVKSSAAAQSEENQETITPLPVKANHGVDPSEVVFHEQGPEYYYKLLTEYHEIEKKRQMIMEKLKKFGSYESQYTPESSNFGLQWASYSSAEEKEESRDNDGETTEGSTSETDLWLF